MSMTLRHTCLSTCLESSWMTKMLSPPRTKESQSSWIHRTLLQSAIATLHVASLANPFRLCHLTQGNPDSSVNLNRYLLDNPKPLTHIFCVGGFFVEFRLGRRVEIMIRKLVLRS